MIYAGFQEGQFLIRANKNTEDKLRMIALIRQTCYSIEPKD